MPRRKHRSPCWRCELQINTLPISVIFCECKIRFSKTTAHRIWMSLFWEEEIVAVEESLSFTPSQATAETGTACCWDFTLPQIDLFHVTCQTADRLLPERQPYGLQSLFKREMAQTREFTVVNLLEHISYTNSQLPRLNNPENLLILFTNRKWFRYSSAKAVNKKR